MRICNLCDWKSESDEPAEALAQFAAHQASHNATPAQWTDAYNSILRHKQKRNATQDV